MTELAGGHLTARAARIAAVVAKHGLRDLRDHGANRAVRLREALEELGPTFAKLGQILSTRPDLIPPDVVAELARLQDDVPPLTEAQVVQVMEEELGVPWEDVFERIEPEPLAAGTIGQVHRARARGRRSRRRQGPAPGRRGGDRARPRPVRALRGEGRGPRGAARAGRHPRRRRAPLVVAPPRARLPGGGVEHRRGCVTCSRRTRGSRFRRSTTSSRPGGCS